MTETQVPPISEWTIFMRVNLMTEGPFTPAEAGALDGVEACVHCGLCLPVCPTYEEWGTSMDSPRGRLLLMKAAAEGQIPVSDKFALHMERCLVCRACETVCPSGVQFGRAMESARAVLQRARAETGDAKAPAGFGNRVIQKILLNKLMTNPNRLRAFGRAARLYQKSGLRGLVRKSGVPGRLRLRGMPLGTLEALLPEDCLDLKPIPPVTPAEGEKRGRVILFTGCVMDVLFRKVHRDTIRCLTANGYEVVVPEGQGCCGALHAHAGEVDAAKSLARRNLEALRGDAPVIVNAAGCGAMLKEYGHVLADDPTLSQGTGEFSGRVRDIHEFLVEIALRPLRNDFPEKVTYQDACHLAHGQRVRRPPRDLLRLVPGMEWTDLPRSDWCCGSAGIYNLTQPEAADRLLEKKVDAIESTGASVLAVGNPGCALQIEMGLRRRGLSVRVMHPVEILAEAYGRT